MPVEVEPLVEPLFEPLIDVLQVVSLVLDGGLCVLEEGRARDERQWEQLVEAFSSRDAPGRES